MDQEYLKILERDNDNKIKIIENAYLLIFGMNLVVTLLSYSRTTYQGSSELKIMISMSSLSAFLVVSILISKFFIKQNRIKTIIYLVLSMIYTIGLHIIWIEKEFVTIAGSLSIILFVVFLMKRIRYIWIYSTVPLGITLYYILNPSIRTIQIGQSYYISLFFLYLVYIFLLYQGIKQFRWYEEKLLKDIQHTSEQNIELVALNEEYIATQDELFNKYDEVFSLNESLNQAIQKVDTIFNVIRDGLIEYNTESKAWYLNKAARELLDIEEDTITDLNRFISLFSSEDMKKLEACFYDIRNNIVAKSETDIGKEINGVMKFLKVTFLKYDENKENLIIASIRDITLEKEHEIYMSKVAYTDELTGLMNKKALQEHIDKLLNIKDYSFAIYVIDIKGMKNINTMFGFYIGSEIIKSLGFSLLEVLGINGILARTGGDEFSFIMDQSIKPSELLKNLTNQLDMFHTDEMSFRINFKMGVAYSEGIKDAIELFENAEMAMYSAKENITNDVAVYKQDFRTDAEKSLLLSCELENAVDLGEIYLNFQPEMNAKTQKIEAFEALVRWKSHKFGFVSPIDFIRIAEQTGYINILGDFIIKESCRFAKEVIKIYPDIQVSINISGIQLVHEDFVASFLSIIDFYEVPRKNIGVEITETSVIANIEKAKKVLTNLKNEGIHVYLDDFGTGYSSLMYLNALPIDILKIDKSFIDKIVIDKKQVILVESIIQLAKNIGLRVVAEGVEDENQYEILKDLKCDVIQGYYFYKPLDSAIAIQILKENLAKE